MGCLQGTMHIYWLFGFTRKIGGAELWAISVRREEQMPGVRVDENEPFELALRRFRRQCERAGILSEIKKRQHYEKPSVRRKKKAMAARKRLLKALKRAGRI